MNNIDWNKIIKLCLTLLCICIAAGIFSRVVWGNSMTLTEYAALHPNTGSTEAETPAGEEASEEETTESSEEAETLTESSVASTEESEIPTESSTEAVITPATTLIGCSLNSDLMLEERVAYSPEVAADFYYEPLSEHLIRYITGISYPAVSGEADSSMLPAITYDELRYVHILHYDFEGNPVEGELICNIAIAQDLVEIFYELYRNEYQLEKVLLIDEYDGDDTASMEDNNTSCFNYRVVDGTSSLSKHAYGLAIDVNPFYNPYITYNEDGSIRVSPADAEAYADRSSSFPYKIDESDLCYRLFMEHGFTWGGVWNSSKDYQHFQKVTP